MGTYAAEGIVLKRVEYGDSDRILTLLTKEQGKIGIIAKGVRKPTSTVAPATDLFAKSAFQLAAGKTDLDIVRSAEVIDPFETGGSLGALVAASACADMCERLLVEHYADPGVYELLDAMRNLILRDPDHRFHAVCYLGFALMSHLGYAPEVERCVTCQRELEERENSFIAAAGGMRCHRCAPGTSGIPVPVAGVKILRVLLKGDPSTFFRLRLDVGNELLLLALLSDTLLDHVRSLPKSFALLGERLVLENGALA